MKKLEQKLLTAIEKARIEPTEYNTILMDQYAEIKYEGVKYNLVIEYDYDKCTYDFTLYDENDETIVLSSIFVDALDSYLCNMIEQHIEESKIDYYQNNYEQDLFNNRNW